MKWIKKGNIYCPQNKYKWMQSHAQVPVVKQINENKLRIYFGTRDDKNRTLITFIEVDANADVFFPTVSLWFDTFYRESVSELEYDGSCKCIPRKGENKYEDRICDNKECDKVALFFSRYLHNNNDEKNYLNIAKELITEGDIRDDRTGTGVYGMFGKSLEFDLRNNIFPLLTTKRVFTKGIIEELLWFLRGETNSKKLEEKGVNIWKGNTTREFLDNNGLGDYPEGQIGPMYGFNWRHWGEEYTGMNTDYTGKGIDQIKNAIELIKNNPTSRRIVVSCWDVDVMEKGVLNPCHILFQFYVSVERKELSCQLYQRSVDWMLGCPFNIASYALLTHLMAQVTGLKAAKLRMCFGDTHIYSNQLEGVKTQLSRKPRKFPTLMLNKNVKNIDNFKIEDFKILDYDPHQSIKFPFSA